MTQPPDDAALVLRLGSPGWDNFGNFVPPEIKPEDHHAALTGYSYLVMALHRQLAEAATALEAKDRRIAEMREAIQGALQCTPHARETPSGAAVVIYDCGDPWAILRAALEPSDKGVGR